MTVKWEQVGRRRLLARLPVDNGRCAFVEQAGGGYVQYGVEYFAFDDGSLGTISGVYSVKRSLVCLSEKDAKENAEKMLTMHFNDRATEEVWASGPESHYEKACHDSFDYAVLVKVGDAMQWLRVHEIKDHGDGWVTLELQERERADNVSGVNVFGKYPMPRGLSIRKDCIMAVVDAPEGS